MTKTQSKVTFMEDVCYMCMPLETFSSLNDWQVRVKWLRLKKDWSLKMFGCKVGLKMNKKIELMSKDQKTALNYYSRKKKKKKRK